MDKLELKHIQPYLPYKVKVQYEGIINGKEISDYKKKWKEDHQGDFSISYDDYKEPDEIKGQRIGYIKEVCYYNSYTKYRIGVKSGGLQTHYNTDRFKMILRPISDLTKEIELDGKKFIPIEGMFLPCGERELLEGWAEDNKCWIGQQLTYLPYQMLFSMHFDIFNLIEQNLAININDLKS
jgi:hypothetical protein